MTAMMGRYALAALVAAGLAGCGGQRGPDFDVPPLQVLQMRAYPEAVTGRFVSLADFEDSPLVNVPGHEQVSDFSVVGADAGGELKFVVNITRTGAGALEALLPAGGALVFGLPDVHDFSRYTLLGVSVYSREIRDDLKVRLSTDRAAWESLPVLLRPGWNEVLIDLQRLRSLADFDARRVRSIRLWFSAAASPVRINLDDVLLIDNRRAIRPLPEGMRLIQTGLDYELRLGHRALPIRIRQGDDGLWRLGADQAILSVFGDSPQVSSGPGRARESLSALGRRRVGEVELLEYNRIRLRLANTWYFPTTAGQWASLAVPMVRWEYTFYADGRWVTDVIVNAAGSKPIRRLQITAPEPVVWSDGTRGPVMATAGFGGSAGRWGFLRCPEVPQKKLYESNYAKPGRLERRMGIPEVVNGDVNGDGFDEATGCYRLRAQAGQCRFLLDPPREGLCDAVVRVAGQWSGPVAATCDGRALRDLVELDDGSVLFVLRGLRRRPRWVEVTGRAGLPKEGR